MKKALLSALLVVSFAFVAVPTFAQQEQPTAGQLLTGKINAQKLGLNDVDLRTNVLSGIKYLLGFVGLACVSFVIYAGIIWMTARGNEDKVAEAKGIIFNAMIGLIVVMFSYSIVYFVQVVFPGGAQIIPIVKPGGYSCVTGSECQSGVCAPDITPNGPGQNVCTNDDPGFTQS